MNRPFCRAAEILFLFSSLSLLSSGLCDVITVDSSNTLQQYLCGTNDQQIPNNTEIELVSSSYVLNASKLCLVSDRHNIAIVSKQLSVIISCTSNTGLGFVNVNVLNINNIQIKNCGASIVPLADRIGSTTGPYLSNTSYASLAIVDSSEVSLSSVTITEYYGYAILVVNVYEVSNLSELKIIDKNISNINGSGVMVYYHNSSKPASLTISNSQFAFNQIFISSVCFPETLAPLSDGTPIPTPYGSALSVVHNQISQKVSVIISNCNITQNIGSPVVMILYFDTLPNYVTTVISGTQVSTNQRSIFTMPKMCHGAGFAMVTYFSKNFAMSIPYDWTSVSVSDTTIKLEIFNSEAQSVLYLSTSQINNNQSMQVHYLFKNVTFKYNGGAEVLYAETIVTSDKNIKSLKVHLIDVLVDGNMQNQVTKNYRYMPGAILTFVDVAAVYLSDTHFTRNVGSVIEAYNTDVYMSGNVSFQYNYGSNGAALLLLGQSYLFLYF